MDHLDTKRLSFVIYLLLRMHQFQKYHLLRQMSPADCQTMILSNCSNIEDVKKNPGSSLYPEDKLGHQNIKFQNICDYQV